MHDDQHGTAIITHAGLINAVRIAARKGKLRLSLTEPALRQCLYQTSRLYWCKEKNVVMVDTKEFCVRTDRPWTNNKQTFCNRQDIHTLEEAIKARILVSHQRMCFTGWFPDGGQPIVLQAIPILKYRRKAWLPRMWLMATGRSDIPPGNKFLGFPLFSGALDVRATCIMKRWRLPR